MLKKVMATAAVTLSVAGLGSAMAPRAIAAEGDNKASQSGNGSKQNYGNFATHGKMSTQPGLIQGSLNKPCIGLPLKANAGSVAGVVPITVQDIPILSPHQIQQCAENSTQVKRDEALSRFLEDARILSTDLGRGRGGGMGH